MTEVNPGDNDHLDYALYIIAETQYLKTCKSRGFGEEDVFPTGWYRNRNYHQKTEILAKAIKQNVLIQELPSIDGSIW